MDSEGVLDALVGDLHRKLVHALQPDQTGLDTFGFVLRCDYERDDVLGVLNIKSVIVTVIVVKIRAVPTYSGSTVCSYHT